MNKQCLDCSEPIKGRADKKFCSDQCRNNFNNQLNSDRNNFMRSINNILRRNRRILCELNPEDKVRVHKDKLMQRGFNFRYFTNTYTTQKGATYYFCYEQGYLPLENEFYALVLKKEY
jgi:predicted nucleic acid-binding Zn ribbon protein